MPAAVTRACVHPEVNILPGRNSKTTAVLSRRTGGRPINRLSIGRPHFFRNTLASPLSRRRRIPKSLPLEPVLRTRFPILIPLTGVFLRRHVLHPERVGVLRDFDQERDAPPTARPRPETLRHLARTLRPHPAAEVNQFPHRNVIAIANLVIELHGTAHCRPRPPKPHFQP